MGSSLINPLRLNTFPSFARRASYGRGTDEAASSLERCGGESRRPNEIDGIRNRNRQKPRTLGERNSFLVFRVAVNLGFVTWLVGQYLRVRAIHLAVKRLLGQVIAANRLVAAFFQRANDPGAKCRGEMLLTSCLIQKVELRVNSRLNRTFAQQIRAERMNCSRSGLFKVGQSIFQVSATGFLWCCCASPLQLLSEPEFELTCCLVRECDRYDAVHGGTPGRKDTDNGKFSASPLGEGRCSKLFSPHSQMGTAAHFRSRHFFIEHHSASIASLFGRIS